MDIKWLTPQSSTSMFPQFVSDINALDTMITSCLLEGMMMMMISIAVDIICRHTFIGEQLTDIWQFSLSDFSWHLIAGNNHQLYIPPGVAITLIHDYLVFLGG